MFTMRIRTYMKPKKMTTTRASTSMIEIRFGTFSLDSLSMSGFANANMKSARAIGSVTSLAALRTKRKSTTAPKARMFLVCLMYVPVIPPSFMTTEDKANGPS